MIAAIWRGRSATMPMRALALAGLPEFDVGRLHYPADGDHRAGLTLTMTTESCVSTHPVGT